MRFFLAVVDGGGFTAAASRLFVSQPSVSNAIAELEKALGTPLLIRQSRRVFVTSDGEVLAAQARRILALVDEAIEGLSDPGGQHGRLSIGAGPSVGTYVLPSLLGAFRKDVPGAALQLKIAPGSELRQYLRARRLDVCVLADPLEGEFEGVPFMSSEILVVAPPSHPLLSRGEVSLAEVAQQSIILRERDSWTRQAFERILAANGLIAADTLELGNNEAIRRAVESGLGIAPLPKLVVDSDVQAGSLIVLPVQSFPIEIRWQLCWVKGDRLTRTARRFLEFASHSDTSRESTESQTPIVA